MELLHKLRSEAGAVCVVPDMSSAVRMPTVQERPESQPRWKNRVWLAPWEEAQRGRGVPRGAEAVEELRRVVGCWDGKFMGKRPL